VGTCVAVYQYQKFMMLTALNAYKLSATVPIIFNHQDVPSLFRKYPVKMSHVSLGKISGYICSCLLINNYYQQFMMLTAISFQHDFQLHL